MGMAETKITLDVSELQASIREAKKSISSLESEFKSSTAGMDDWTQTSEGLEKKLSTLKGVLEQQKNILSSYEQQLAKTQNAYSENGRLAEQLKAKMQQLTSEGVSKSSDEYKKLQQELAENLKEQNKQKLSIETLNSNIIKFKGNVAKTEKEIRQYTSAEEKLERENNSVSSTLDKQQKELDELKKRYADVVASSNRETKEAKELAKQITSLSADVKKNSNALEEASKDADSFDKSLKNTEKQSKSTGSALDGLAGKIGAVAKKGLQIFATAVGTAITSMSAMTVSAGKYADEVNTMSKVTGLSTEKIQELNFASELLDVSIETVAKSLARNTKAMANAQKGSKEYTEAYKKLGVSVTDSNGKLRDSEEVFWASIDALGKMQNETERDAIAMQLFGRSAQELNPLIEAGSDKLQELTKQAHDMGVVMSQESLDALNEFNDSLDILKNGASGLKNVLGTVLLPMLKNVTDFGGDLIGQVTNGLQEAKDLEDVADVLGDGIERVVDFLFENLPTFVDFGVKIVKAIGKGIMDNAELIIWTAFELIGEFANMIIDNLPKILDTGFAIIEKLLEGITEKIPDIIQKIVDLIPKIVDVIAQHLPTIIEGGIKLIMALARGIIEAIPQIIEVLPDLINALLDAILSNLPLFIEAGIDLFVALVENIPAIISGLIKAIPKIIEGLIKAILKFGEKMKDVGLRLIQGIWEGISGAGQWLWDKITGFFGSIVDGIKNFLGIHSPSSLMSDIVGKNMALGIGKGFTDALPNVAKQMAESLSGLTESVKVSPSLQLAGNGAMNYTQIINSPKALSRIEIYRDTRNMLDLVRA